MPSQLLERRPDIRRAEARLHAATARIGVAKADLFPKFFLSGSAGLRADDLDSWSASVTRLWSAGPSVSWNIFNGGRTRARIEENKALAEQALIGYRKAILTALEEVESSWVAFEKEAERQESLKEAIEQNRRAVELANRLYVEGQNDFLSVLVAERSLYAAQAELVRSRNQEATNLVSLYKALGGGWESVSAPGQSRK
jgi:NodT family efflux transporter outer membrane factor (OMF) lipoprotein